MSTSLTSLLEHATSQGYRSNVVKPLLGMVIILSIGTIFLFKYEAIFFGYVFGSLASVVVICFLVSYFICLFKNPDLLRSEKYNLEKTAIEKVSFSGDSVAGQVQISPKDYVLISSLSQKHDSLISDANTTSE